MLGVNEYFPEEIKTKGHGSLVSDS